MIVYLTVNLKTGLGYVGKSLTDKPAYLGSGKILKLAIKKYGKDNFSKTILGDYATVAELNTAEASFIVKHNTRVPNGYNIAGGGDGGVVWLGPHPNKGRSFEQIHGSNAGALRITLADSARKRVNGPNWGKPKKGKESLLFGKGRTAAHKALIRQGTNAAIAKMSLEKRRVAFGRPDRIVSPETKQKLTVYEDYAAAKRYLAPLHLRNKQEYLEHLEKAEIALHNRPVGHYYRRGEWVSWADYLTLSEEAVQAAKELDSEKRRARQSGAKNSSAGYRNIPVIQSTLKGVIVQIWADLYELKEAMPVRLCYVIACCKKKPKYHSHAGFRWQFDTRLANPEGCEMCGA